MRMNRTIGITAALLAAVLAIGAYASNGTQPASAGGDPLAVVQNLVDAANASIPTGDSATFAAAFTEDGFFENIDGGSFGIVGREAITGAFGEEADPDFNVTLLNSEVDGNTVTGSVRVVDADSVAAGVPSHIELFRAVVEGDLVASLRITYDTTDPDTVTYLQYLADNEEEDEGPPPGTVELDMEGDQEGSVFLADLDDVRAVALEIDPGADGVLQPAHVHTGTCEEPGPIVYPLATVKDGGSFTLLSASVDDLLESDYIVNVHLSEAEPGTYVSCAPLVAPEQEEEPTVQLPPTGSGGTGAGTPWLFVALAAALAAGLAGLSALRMRSR